MIYVVLILLAAIAWLLTELVAKVLYIKGARKFVAGLWILLAFWGFYPLVNWLAKI